MTRDGADHLAAMVDAAIGAEHAAGRLDHLPGIEQLTEADLDHLSPREIADAHNAGRFDYLLARKAGRN